MVKVEDVKRLNSRSSRVLNETAKQREEFKECLLESKQVAKGGRNAENKVLREKWEGSCLN